MEDLKKKKVEQRWLVRLNITHITETWNEWMKELCRNDEDRGKKENKKK